MINIDSVYNIKNEYDLLFIKMNKRIIKEKLFPSISSMSDNIYDKLMIDNESVTYITIPADAEIITRYIDKHIKYLKMDIKELIITDGSAGVGGNVLSFAGKFKYVNAIEIDTQRYQYLCNNINAYGYTNVMCYNDDCLKLVYDLKADVVFFDPPWGGENYKDESRLKLKLSEQPIEDICTKLMMSNNIKLIALKLPKNYDTRYMYSVFKPIGLKLYVYNLSKMIIVIIVHHNIVNSNEK